MVLRVAIGPEHVKSLSWGDLEWANVHFARAYAWFSRVPQGGVPSQNRPKSTSLVYMHGSEGSLEGPGQAQVHFARVYAWFRGLQRPTIGICEGFRPLEL